MKYLVSYLCKVFRHRKQTSIVRIPPARVEFFQQLFIIQEWISSLGIFTMYKCRQITHKINKAQGFMVSLWGLQQRLYIDKISKMVIYYDSNFVTVKSSKLQDSLCFKQKGYPGCSHIEGVNHWHLVWMWHYIISNLILTLFSNF